MSRHQARFAVGSVVILLLGVVGYYWSVNTQAQRRNVQLLRQLAGDVQEDETDQRMQKFRRVKMEDGRKVWEVTAQQARYFDKTHEVTVDTPHVSLYLDDGGEISLRCQEARLYLDANKQEVIRMKLQGNLEIDIGDLSIRTQEAVYERGDNTISSSGLVHIMSQGFEAEGRGYTVNVADKRLRLNTDVHTTVTREAG